jgi:hypothetical protein
VVIPIATNWTVFQITPPLEALLKKVDAFTAAQMPRDYI